jgi:hypothetical protein
MIEGFRDKDGNLVRQSIWLDVRSKQFPMLVTLNRTPTKFRSDLSDCGIKLNSDDFSINHKFIVHLDSVYFVKNDMSLWNDVCSNGLFNIWKPEAPFSRFKDSESDAANYRICLLRLYEIYEEFKSHEIVAVSSRIDHLKPPNRVVTIKKAILSDEEFRKTRKLLEDSVCKYLLKDPIKYPELEITEESLFLTPDEVSDDATLYEGAKLQITVNAYERNPEARHKCIAHYGTTCFVCGFDFGLTYGEVGRGFIHSHHLHQLSDIGEEYVIDPINDLRPVCPNCHAIIHKRKPPYSIDEVKSLLYQKSR